MVNICLLFLFSLINYQLLYLQHISLGVFAEWQTEIKPRNLICTITA